MNLYRLGSVSWLDSQLIYHALPRLGMEGLVILRPASPYVSLGFHQDAEQEIDLDYCRAQGIPVFRREVGGGAVYLDGGQIFYQIVLGRDHPLVQGPKEALYRRLLAPVVAVYRDLGLDATFKPVNDILVEGRKISGNGAGEIAESVVLVGNLIADFDYDTMVRVLRVPEAKFRDHVYHSLRGNLTTLRRELGEVPPTTQLEELLVRRFAEVLGPLEPATLPATVRQEVERLEVALTREEWLLRRGRRLPERQITIAAGHHVAQHVHKAPGGLIRATVETAGERLVSVDITGDFFFYPPDLPAALSRELAGCPRHEVQAAIAAFYERTGADSPGVTPADLARALLGE